MCPSRPSLPLTPTRPPRPLCPLPRSPGPEIPRPLLHRSSDEPGETSGRQSRSGGEAGAQLQRAGGASWRCSVLAAHNHSDTDKSPDPRASPTEFRSHGLCRPGSERPLHPEAPQARTARAGRRLAGSRAAAATRTWRHTWGSAARGGQCAPATVAASAPDHGVRPPVLVRPPGSGSRTAVGPRRTGASG